ncbi:MULTISPECIES: YdeI/OmpD-associated family protein [unclassified Sphingobacterium]|uniref:YdeI/OmpD-associated family protein n=1 Tax=unclassified Sphingobacterium TaxID=2609468 RepID=UPI0025E248F1|nr:MULTISPECIES: YdeI/OmpD-associated family protein [unclassified Sphingobacterium]
MTIIQKGTEGSDLLVDNIYNIEKFEGKGGWHFIRLPEIAQDRNAKFGWVRVSGTIDHYEIRHYNLQAMGNGILFLPLKADIRKKINKKEGDQVHVRLFRDNSDIEIPKELKACLTDEPALYRCFINLPEKERKSIIKRICSATKEADKIKRIAQTLQDLSRIAEF